MKIKILRRALSLLAILLFFIAFSSKESEARPKHIAILVSPHWQGDLAFAHRLKAASENLHWTAELVFLPQEKDLRSLSCDFAINLSNEPYKPPRCKQYLVLFLPDKFFFNNGKLRKRYQHHNGYLLTYQPKKTDPNFGTSSKAPFMPWFPSVQHQDARTVNPRFLSHILCKWGNRFTDPKFTRLFQKLDQTSWTHFYGDGSFRELYPRNYQFSPPYDQDLSALLAEDGICLILHSAEHNAAGIPSGRIFEAAAASTVIICDENPFVKERFKDSVLYIDTNRDSLYEQVETHIKWIQANKELALQKAREAHEIFKREFSLETQLLQLEKFHTEISKSYFKSRKA